ncbi:MAG: hypothetical protein ACRENG_33165 [bacterium]
MVGSYKTGIPRWAGCLFCCWASYRKSQRPQAKSLAHEKGTLTEENGFITRMKKKIYQFCTIIFIAIGQINSAEAQKKTFSLDDILRLPIVGDVAISPKGDWVAYTLSELDLEHNGSNSRKLVKFS